jgi:DNA-binding NarL/FixJ family response regulator
VAEPTSPIRVVVLADDLIWATRLASQVRTAGFVPVAARAAEAFRAKLPAAGGAIVDLTSRAYDGLAAIAAARDAGVPVLAVGQHDDHVLRRDALAVGADRVLAYRKLFQDGPATIARWLAAARTGPPNGDPESTPGSPPAPDPRPEPTEAPAR